MQALKSNKEGEAWNSPGVSEQLVPTGVIVDKTGTERNHQRDVGGYRKVENGTGFSQKLWIVLLVAVLTALTASQALQWVKIKEGERCPHLLNDHPPRTTNKGAPPKIIEAIYGVGTSEHEHVQRQKREIPEQIYISLDQYLEGQAGLRTEIRQMASHPAARFALRGYISDHEIDTMTSFHWQSVGEQSMFTLTPAGIGKDLQVQTPGYYHISLSVMFNGRTSPPRNNPACSLKVVSTTNSASPNQNDHKALLYLSRTQVGNGRRIRSNSWPIDTAQASGIFLLHRGDIIYVKPGTYSVGCKIYTRSFKTHLDAFLVSRVTA